MTGPEVLDIAREAIIKARDCGALALASLGRVKALG